VKRCNQDFATQLKHFVVLKMSIRGKKASETGVNMSTSSLNRRNFLQSSYALAGTTLISGASGFIMPAHAQGLAPTATMRGGANNYLPDAPVVKRIGNGGFFMSGTVRRAGDGAPLRGIRIQIWAHTTEGSESDRHSHGATLTGDDGIFRLEMPQIVPAFGQAHGHLAYEGNGFKTVFLRPVMASAKDTSLSAHFVLLPT
jgi:hypothetical protein